MNLERLKQLREAVDMAIKTIDGPTTCDLKTPENFADTFRISGAIPLVHHLVIRDFAITDLKEFRQQIAARFYSQQPHAWHHDKFVPKPAAQDL